MDSQEQDHAQEMLRTYKRRLYALELKQAWSGINTPPEILMEIEDLRENIEQCQSQIDAFPQIYYASQEAGQFKAEKKLGADRKQIEITFNGSFDDLSPEIQNAVVRAIAGILEIPPDQVKVLRTSAGSVVFVIELPAEAANTLLKLFRSGDKIVTDLGIQKIESASGQDLSPPNLVKKVIVEPDNYVSRRQHSRRAAHQQLYRDIRPGQNAILIVDSEDRSLSSLSLILQNENYLVETAANIRDALLSLQSQEYDLMFLNLDMPGTSGIDLLSKVNSQFPHMPVLTLSENPTLESAIQAARLGARDHLIKPLEPVMILTRVAEILAEREQPARKKKISEELRALLAELQQMEEEAVAPTGTSDDLPSSSAGRLLKKGIFELDLHARQVALNGKYIPVTGIYFDYLRTLLRHSPKAVTYQTLVKESQGYDVALAEARDLARWRIYELRKMVEVDSKRPQSILTVRGIGYRLETQNE